MRLDSTSQFSLEDQEKLSSASATESYSLNFTHSKAQRVFTQSTQLGGKTLEICGIYFRCSKYRYFGSSYLCTNQHVFSRQIQFLFVDTSKSAVYL
jgi:hypothetical protein